MTVVSAYVILTRVFEFLTTSYTSFAQTYRKTICNFLYGEYWIYFIVIRTTQCTWKSTQFATNPTFGTRTWEWNDVRPWRSNNHFTGRCSCSTATNRSPSTGLFNLFKNIDGESNETFYSIVANKVPITFIGSILQFFH